jgi:hypothetical protein
MSNDEDFVLTLMKAKKHDPVAYPETFHVGFYVDDAATVRAKRDELTVAGFSPGEIHDAGRHGRGAHFYCAAPGNVVVEIATPPQRESEMTFLQNRHPALAYWWSMIFSENRCPLFGIML